MKDAIFHWYADLYDTVLRNSAVGNQISNIFTGEDNTYKVVADKVLTALSGDITDVVSAIALAVTTLFFVIALLDLAMTDRFTLEYFIKFFSKLAVSIILITMCSEITSMINKLGTIFCELIGDAASSQDFSVADQVLKL